MNEKGKLIITAVIMGIIVGGFFFPPILLIPMFLSAFALIYTIVDMLFD